MDEALAAKDRTEPPAMGERRARWGYGYQDKVATERILSILKSDLRSGDRTFEGIRLADLEAGRVDDFVLVWGDQVEGNSIKWSDAASPMTWGDLIGANGLLKELAEGWSRLRARWVGRAIAVRLQSNRPASAEVHHAQLVPDVSVEEFLRTRWTNGPMAEDPPQASGAWVRIAAHVGLPENEFVEFVQACRFSLGHPEPSQLGPDTRDWRHYRTQFERLHAAIALWVTNNPEEALAGREYLLRAIGFKGYDTSLIQRFPAPQIPYEQNGSAAERLRTTIERVEGGYVAITGVAGTGKSPLVQDVLSGEDYPFTVPYYAFLPDGEGNPRDRGEALTFFQDISARMDSFFAPRYSLGIADVAEGREALRAQMSKANEQFVIQGRKTILLIDGLDHVSREVGLADSVLRQLPAPSEVPTGFVIVLSSQPQALEADVVGAAVASVVAEGTDRRVEVGGLEREEVHAIVTSSGMGADAQEKDLLFEACQGNPLILTYLLKRLATGGISVESVVAESGRYEGDIDDYYAQALAVPVREPSTRRLLALLCRAAPTIPADWLAGWPEAASVEELYLGTLAPFVRVEEGNIYFIHNSLVAFLKDQTRPKIPGTDAAAQERALHSDLADRCGSRPIADPLGRARILHLLRAGRREEVLGTLTSDWVRGAAEAFLPYALVRPLVLAGLDAAWALGEMGHVVRLILLDHELGQRSSRIDPGDLAERLLALGLRDVATFQVRAAGQLLVEEKIALRYAERLGLDALREGSEAEREAARRLYTQAKPVALVFPGEPIDPERSHGFYDALIAWGSCAPLFEAPEAVTPRIGRLEFASGPGDAKTEDSARIKAGLYYAAFLTALGSGAAREHIAALVGEIRALGSSEWLFGALLNAAESGYDVAPGELADVYSAIGRDGGLALAYASFLVGGGDLATAREVVSALSPLRFETIRRERSMGYTDVSYTVTLRRLQASLGLPEGPPPQAKDGREEALARVETAARKLGELWGRRDAGEPSGDLREDYREILLFHNRKVTMPYDRREGYVISWSRMEVYRSLVRLAEASGRPGLEALAEAVTELMAGPAATQFSGPHRRLFAAALFRGGKLDPRRAGELGLSSVSDTETDDPAERQQACLDIALFLSDLGDEKGKGDWIRRAAQVSAGAGSHKDYHMDHLSEWIGRAAQTNDGQSTLPVVAKLARAVQVAGGAGASQAAERLVRIVAEIVPTAADAFAEELVDRQVLNLSQALSSLVQGGAEAGADAGLLTAVHGELLSLLAPLDFGKVSVAVANASPAASRASVARELMRDVRTNALPSQRISVARKLEDALRQAGLGEVDLATGLPAGEHDSSMKNLLYRLEDGTTRTVGEVAAILSDSGADWNPNPEQNGEFGWWGALREVKVVSIDHLDRLVAAFPPPDYLAFELTAWKADRLLDLGERDAAARIAERAVAEAADGTWFQGYDGARKVRAYRVLRRTDAQAISRAREQFGRDLIVGRLGNYLLLDALTDIFEFLEIEWPAADVLRAVDGYLDQVLAANVAVAEYRSLAPVPSAGSVEDAILRFIARLSAFPVIDIGVAARRCLGRYVAGGGQGLARLLQAAPCWDSVQLEHLLAALHAGSRLRPSALDGLRDYVASLNRHESVAVRGLARRICAARGWNWTELREEPEPTAILVAPGVPALPRSYDVSRQLVGGDAAVAAGLYRWVFPMLSRDEDDSERLWPEYAGIYDQVEGSYRWKNDVRFKTWMSLALARHWLHQRAIIGREAIMRLIGRKALIGAAPPWVEDAYDLLGPIYDPHLELAVPSPRPHGLETMEWGVMEEREKAWLRGDEADAWDNYPHWVEGMAIIGERSWFIRPEWEWPREERCRGLTDGSEGIGQIDRDVLASNPGLTCAEYLDGKGQRDDQIVVWNSERELMGPMYRWIAIASRFASELGWRPSDAVTLQWEDERGDIMVRSMYWKDGWISLEPPRFESLGEGWVVLASPSAVESIRVARPDAKVHLWVERHSHGDKPFEGHWHLARAL